MDTLRKHSLGITFAVLTIAFTTASLISTIPEDGFKEWFKEYTNNGSTEMLQLFMIVVFTKWLREVGSAEDKGN